MRNWRKTLLILSLAAVLVVIVFSRTVSEREFPGSTTDSVAVTDSGPDGQVNVEPKPVNQTNVRGSSQADAPADVTAGSAVPEFLSPYPLAENVSIGRWMEDYADSIRRSTPEDFEQKREEADELDAEAAYWLHEFYKFCDHQPRSDWQLDNALSRVESHVDRAARDRRRERRLDRAQETLDEYEQGYQLCSFLGPDFDAKAASLAWLETAANLGHMAALRLYHSQARELLTEDDSTLGFRQPDLIHLFKSNAKKYARQLLETGHPQGYLLMARMYYVGDVFEQDFNLAYSYAYAGFLAGATGAQYDAQMWMRVIAQNLPPTDIPAAEKLARDIINPD